MSNPTRKQFVKMITTMATMLPLAKAEGHLDMGEIDIADSKKHICKTPMCHGGWYAVAKGDYSNTQLGSPADFITGANALARDLGFSGRWELRYWAAEHPELWGSVDGSSMFGSSAAFNYATTLLEVVNWWVRVCNRCHPNDEPLPEYT